MAHEVQNMAYVGDIPWHGLGHRLSPKQPIAVWQRQAGMDWSIRETDVLFSISGNEGLHLKAKPDHKVLFRSDSGEALSVVSKRLCQSFTVFEVSPIHFSMASSRLLSSNMMDHICPHRRRSCRPSEFTMRQPRREAPSRPAPASAAALSGDAIPGPSDRGGIRTLNLASMAAAAYLWPVRRKGTIR